MGGQGETPVLLGHRVALIVLKQVSAIAVCLKINVAICFLVFKWPA